MPKTKLDPNRREYYVYSHIDPRTQETLYVGHGCRARAWMYYVPFREHAHSAYMDDLVSLGFLPCDFVIIHARGLNKKQARLIEKQLTESNRPKFNKEFGVWSVKTTKEQFQQALLLREQGLSYAKIAEQLDGPHTMTIYRAINNLTPSLEKSFAI